MYQLKQLTMEPRNILEFAVKKGPARIIINNFLCAFAIALLVIYLKEISKQNTFDIIILQLTAAIPFLFTSSLSYTKISYRHPNEYHVWNNTAWLTHTIGYFLIINALFLILVFNKKYTIAFVFLGITIGLTLLYSIIDIVLDKKRLSEKLGKEFFYISCVVFGSLLPYNDKKLFYLILGIISLVVSLIFFFSTKKDKI